MNDDIRELEIKLTLGEINQILDALGSLPYRQVYQLIGKIQMQAESQLQQPQPNGILPTTPFISE